uniref:Uncharacterized protein n=1 Tax=Candidatus Kentrum sp. SD TaxID=2126332 RepID=A0A450YD93_9GAMM|nr:MAG: hypothetical protein BECKSD772F_GA0070984_104210 [Candidatus Kentron sp. SD]VFK44686.1 MAG: hypothetical protein BECKSD772E_GA0070983_104211 [Candidatus Kentron sp. SD]VFK79424.1 MAG: hypothetical protein BECKSD772D_GA0070982_104910 [Candidatus Kentron sp. SD]
MYRHFERRAAESTVTRQEPNTTLHPGGEWKLAPETAREPCYRRDKKIREGSIRYAHRPCFAPWRASPTRWHPAGSMMRRQHLAHGGRRIFAPKINYDRCLRTGGAHSHARKASFPKCLPAFMALCPSPT